MTEQTAPEIVVGREYRLLPDAKCHDHGPGFADGEVWFHDVTRVRVVRETDDDGDVLVERLNGYVEDGDDDRQYVAASFLAEIEEPS